MFCLCAGFSVVVVVVVVLSSMVLQDIYPPPQEKQQKKARNKTELRRKGKTRQDKYIIRFAVIINIIAVTILTITDNTEHTIAMVCCRMATRDETASVWILLFLSTVEIQNRLIQVRIDL